MWKYHILNVSKQLYHNSRKHWRMNNAFAFIPPQSSMRLSPITDWVSTENGPKNVLLTMHKNYALHEWQKAPLDFCRHNGTTHRRIIQKKNNCVRQLSQTNREKNGNSFTLHFFATIWLIEQLMDGWSTNNRKQIVRKDKRNRISSSGICMQEIPVFFYLCG